jgi:AraC-like DNA-binding protein
MGTFMNQAAQEQAYLWKPKALDGVSLFKAQFTQFVYNKHTHDEFAIGVIEYGAQKFYHNGKTNVVPTHGIVTVNPDEVHDGETATDTGYRYRMTYIQPEVISEMLTELYGTKDSLKYFANPVTIDHEVSKHLLHALLLFDQKNENFLEAQTHFIQAITELFMRHARPQQSPLSPKKNHAVIRKACEFIQAMAPQNISLDDISHEVGVSRFHFLRLFKTTTGLSPHAYLIQRRVEMAKTLIENGSSLIDAAFEAGFADQSHMTRRFKAAYGVTPGQYQKAILL